MRLLVLGGTEFVGAAVVDEALAAGWHVTTFNRGTRAAHPGVEHRSGDRLSDTSALAAGEWDAVVDTWSWAPAAVRDSAALLRDRVGTYVYVSSRSVYDPQSSRSRASAGPCSPAPAWSSGRARTSAACRGGSPGRPGVGTSSPPGRPPGASSTSTRATSTMADLLEAWIAVTGSTGRLRWVAPEVVLDAGIEPWTQLPAWLPPGEEHDGLMEYDVSKALSSGLVIRPLRETVADTWEWLQSIGGVAPRRPDRPAVGLDPSVEAAVLARLDS